jgi:hypothetical protein
MRIKYLDVVDRMDVLETVEDYTAYVFEPFECTHACDRVSLHHHVAFSKQLDRTQRVSVRSDKSLTTFNKPVLVTHNSA